ncbi:hybrid sensor histidine kinase/response regulator [Paraburkholderia sp.]|jgi:PAS domain S-box-containing protein|uniref:hybrid sensor histidine kinase/response regulator n=1 Tax=Paraburkholderia sp. TaxID=1926495 RepID=UPI002F3FB7D2
MGRLPGKQWDADAAYERAPCGLIVAAAGGKIIRVNKTCCEWLGFSAAQLVETRSFQDLLTIGGKIFLLTHVMPLLQMQRSVAEIKLDLRHRDGRAVPMLVNISRISDAGCELDEFSVMVMSDRHKYERELVVARTRLEESLQAKEAAELALRAADRRKDEFLATLAHELRNPLGAMRTAIDLLRRPELLGGDTAWPLQLLARQLDQASRLTDDLLDASRIGEGKIELRKTTVEIGAILHEVVESTRARHFAHGPSHEVETHIPPERIYVHADPLRVSQVIQNLLNNALRYTPSGGKICLSAERQDDQAVITVRDNGIGIARNDLPTIFQMFAQAPSARGRVMGGLGVGLALVRALVELHDGRVTVDSRGPGHGTSFEVRLPALPAEPQPLPSPAVESSGSSATQRRVLVVDDNEGAAASLAILLESEGHTAQTATSGRDALRAADEFVPEVVVLDLGLPDIDGAEVARRIRSHRGSSVALIALTGWAPDNNASTSQNLFDAYFVKPVDVAKLLDALEQMPGA